MSVGLLHCQARGTQGKWRHSGKWRQHCEAAHHPIEHSLFPTCSLPAHSLPTLFTPCPAPAACRSLRAAQRSQAVDKGDAEREEGNQKGESREASGKVADQDPNAEEEEMVTEADGSSSVRLPPRPPGSAYLLGGPGGWLDEQGVWMRALAPAVKSWLGTTRVFQVGGLAALNSHACVISGCHCNVSAHCCSHVMPSHG